MIDANLPDAPETQVRPTFIRGAQLRKRWGGMSNSGFYDKLKRGLIPQPEYPFGSDTPYWRVSTIEAFEAQSATATDPAKGDA